MAGGTVSIVTDKQLALAATGNTTCGSSKAATSASGAGYLLLTNTDGPGGSTIYLGTGTVDNSKYPLPPGVSVTWPLTDVSTINCFSSGTPVLGWAVLR